MDSPKSQLSASSSSANLCSPKSVCSNMSNPFASVSNSKIKRQEEIASLKSFKWTKNKRRSKEQHDSRYIGHEHLQNIFQPSCVIEERRQLGLRMMVNKDWSNEKSELEHYRIYYDGARPFPSMELVFKLSVFSPIEEEEDEELFLITVTVTKIVLCAYNPVQKHMNFFNTCQVKWNHCISGKVEIEHRLMPFIDVVREVASTVSYKFPDHMYHHETDAFSLATFYSEIFGLGEVIKLPCCLNMFDSCFNKIISSNLVDDLYENDRSIPCLTVVIDRMDLDGKMLETISLATLYASQGNEQDKKPRTTIIDNTSLIGLDLFSDVLPLVFCALKNNGCGKSFTCKITGTFSCPRNVRTIYFNRIDSKSHDNWEKTEVYSIATSYDAAMNELLISNIPFIF